MASMGPAASIAGAPSAVPAGRGTVAGGGVALWPAFLRPWPACLPCGATYFQQLHCSLRYPVLQSRNRTPCVASPAGC